MWWWTDSPCWDCRHGRACGTVDVVAGAAVVHGDDGMGIAVVAAVVGVDGRTCCLVTLSLCYSLSLSLCHFFTTRSCRRCLMALPFWLSLLSISSDFSLAKKKGKIPRSENVEFPCARAFSVCVVLDASPPLLVSLCAVRRIVLYDLFPTRVSCCRCFSLLRCTQHSNEQTNERTIQEQRTFNQSVFRRTPRFANTACRRIRRCFPSWLADWFQ